MNLLTANALLFASCMGDTLRWRLAARNVSNCQQRILLNLLRANADTEFGREHGFARIASIEQYQQCVPVRGYAQFAPYIERIAAGCPRVLTADPVTSFAVTSGSSAASKLIPYNNALLADFQHSIAPWMAGIFSSHPGILLGRSYWQISPLAPPAEPAASGIPVGFGEDAEYFGPRRAQLIREGLAVNATVAGAVETDAFFHESLTQLLACNNLSFISIWNPSFLSLLLMQFEPSHSDFIASLIARGQRKRARAIERLVGQYGARLDRQLASGRTLAESIWPSLRLISCWTDAAAEEAADRLRAFFPHVPIQPKGLIATEGIVSFPWRMRGRALALRSHFFEFIDVEQNRESGPTLLAGQLRAGGRYSVLLTTSGGLYRYRIGDVVEVTGHIASCPLLRFLGKEDGVVDLVGEKLNPIHVEQCGQKLFARLGMRPEFWMIAPLRQNAVPCYCLYLQSHSAVPEDLARLFDEQLRGNFHYAYAQDLGQLGPLALYRIATGARPEEVYLLRSAGKLHRIGSLKQPRLDSRDDWFQLLPRLFCGQTPGSE